MNRSFKRTAFGGFLGVLLSGCFYRPYHPFAGAPAAKALAFEGRGGLERVPENEAVPQMAGMAAGEGFGAPAK
ncbi:MAG: hypothetical protein KGJ84_12725 [Elusimicrobia bacterium]|nr:hypothetical protein [Elusimicrobiota bacterium]